MGFIKQSTSLNECLPVAVLQLNFIKASRVDCRFSYFDGGAPTRRRMLRVVRGSRVNCGAAVQIFLWAESSTVLTAAL